MAEQEEVVGPPSDKRSADDAEGSSMHDLEMIFAPGKPPPSLHRGAEGALPATRASEPSLPAHKEIPKPPRPPRKAAAPSDTDAGDLAAFAAIGGSIPAPPIDDKDKEPHPVPRATIEPLRVENSAAASKTEAGDKGAATEGAEASSTVEADAPPPESKRIKARVLPRLRKPLPLPFPDRSEGREDDWKSPPDASLQDFKKLTSSDAPRRKNTESVDFDAILGMNNNESHALSAPIVPPDLAKLLSDPAPSASIDPGVSSPPRPKKRSNSDAIASAVSAAPSEAPRKKKKGPQSNRAPRISDAPISDASTEKRSKKAASKDLAPIVTIPPKEQKSSKVALYAVLAAALFGGGYLLLRGPSTPQESPKAEQPTAQPVKTEMHPAEAAPMPTEPAPVEKVATSEPAPAPTNTAPVLSGPMPHSTGAPVAATPAPTSATPAPTAKPTVVSSGDFDRGAASAALSGVAGSAGSCKQSGDPSGVAHVQVTFAPSGHVTVANISGPPFAGTATGGCIARSFKSASVPPFTGDAVTVSKTVNIP